MKKALVYVLRPMFAEEPGLLEYMGEKGVCDEISVADYEGGSWAATMERASKAREGRSIVDVGEGSVEVARMVENLLK